jgi:hypothetical protein
MSLSLFQRRHEEARAGVAVMDAASLREKAAVERALEARDKAIQDLMNEPPKQHA